MINHVNSEIFEFCCYRHQLGSFQHRDFVKNHEMRKEFFWKDLMHPHDNCLRQVTKDFIKHVRFRKLRIRIHIWIITHTHTDYFKNLVKMTLVKSGLNFSFNTVCRYITNCSFHY